MLRIITSRHGSRSRLELHGSVMGEWVTLLEGHWRGITDGAGSARITVDLSNVVFIDEAGADLFRRMARSGVRFDGSGAMNHYVIEKVSGGV